MVSTKVPSNLPMELLVIACTIIGQGVRSRRPCPALPAALARVRRPVVGEGCGLVLLQSGKRRGRRGCGGHKFFWRWSWSWSWSWRFGQPFAEWFRQPFAGWLRERLGELRAPGPSGLEESLEERRLGQLAQALDRRPPLVRVLGRLVGERPWQEDDPGGMVEADEAVVGEPRERRADPLRAPGVGEVAAEAVGAGEVGGHVLDAEPVEPFRRPVLASEQVEGEHLHVVCPAARPGLRPEARADALVVPREPTSSSRSAATRPWRARKR
jgi:hypothetical protein